MTSKPLNAIIIISIAIIRGSCNGSKSLPKVKQLEKRRIRQQKKPYLRIKKQQEKHEKNTGKEKLPAGNQPETVIVF